MKNLIVFLFGLCFLLSCQSQQKVEYLQSEKFAKQNMPFSEAVQVGNMLYLSGQVGNIPGEMNVVSGGIGSYTRQTMENIKAVLVRYVSPLDHVVMCLCRLEDIYEWS